MTDYKTSAARRRANKKYMQKHKQQQQRYNKKSAAKSFILTLATNKDLDQLQEYIKERRQQLKDSAQK